MLSFFIMFSYEKYLLASSCSVFAVDIFLSIYSFENGLYFSLRSSSSMFGTFMYND